MTDLISNHDLFNPFGESVRIGCTGAAGDAEISANLHDLCNIHSVDYEQAKNIHFPSGSTSLLQIEQGSLATEIYLDEDSFPIFMAWVEVQK